MDKKPTATEQGTQEKAATPWRVRFTCGKTKPTFNEIRKDLLAATWGNNRMADLLYHFLVVASWDAHNNHLDSAIKKVVVQETHAKIQTKVKVSEPTLVSHLKAFANVGYVRKTTYRGSFEVDFETIEKAFSEAPEKQSTSATSNDDLSLNLSLEREVKELRLEVQKLREQVQDLSLTLASLKFQHAQPEHGFKFNFSLPLVSGNCGEAATEANLAHIFKFAETKKLYLNNSSGLALVDASAPQNPSKNLLDIRGLEDLDKERERDGANAPTPALSSQSEIDADATLESTPYCPDGPSQQKPTREEYRAASERVEEMRGAVEERQATSQEEGMISPTITVGSIIIHKDDPDERRTGKVLEIDPTNGQALALWFGTHVPHWSSLDEMILFNEWCKTHQTRQVQHTGVPGRKPYPKPQATSEHVAAGSSGYEKTAQQNAAPKGKGQGARTERPARQTFGRSVTTAQLTLEGSQVYEWYCMIRACKLRRTPNLVTTCNNLVECDGMDFQNLKEAIEYWEADKWVKSHNIVIDLQELEKPDGKFTFEKAMVQIRRQRATAQSKSSQDDNNIPQWIEETKQRIEEEKRTGEADRRFEEAQRQIAEIQAQNAARKKAAQEKKAVFYQ